MDIEKLELLFEKHHEEYGKFGLVEEKLSARPDLHAFLLLDRLVPGTGDIVSCAAHDEFFLDTNPGNLAAVISEAQVIELIRCGVRWSEDSLAMWA